MLSYDKLYEVAAWSKGLSSAAILDGTDAELVQMLTAVELLTLAA